MHRQVRPFLRLQNIVILPGLLGLAALAMAGCGGQGGGSTAGTAQAMGAPQQLYGEERAGPFANVTPLELAPGGSLGALGLNLEPLFAEELKTPDERLDRLEATVLAMQTDLQTLAPSMQRMAVVEKDLAAAVAELRDILSQQNATPKAEPKPAVKAAPKPAPKAAAPVAKAETPAPVIKTQSDGVAGAILPDSGGISTPAASSSASAKIAATEAGPAIRALRLGEHGARTRLVFDVTTKPAYRTDLDNNEKLLIVEIDGAEWAGKIPAALSSPMIQSYSVQEMENGARFIVLLKKAARISYQDVLNPERANGPYRLVLDLTNG